MKIFSNLIGDELGIPPSSVIPVLELLEGGATIAFIARYRKERTGGLDEIQIQQISESYSKYEDLQNRKNSILKSIKEQGKLGEELEIQIKECRHCQKARLRAIGRLLNETKYTRSRNLCSKICE